MLHNAAERPYTQLGEVSQCPLQISASYGSSLTHNHLLDIAFDYAKNPSNLISGPVGIPYGSSAEKVEELIEYRLVGPCLFCRSFRELEITVLLITMRRTGRRRQCDSFRPRGVSKRCQPKIPAK